MRSNPTDESVIIQNLEFEGHRSMNRKSVMGIVGHSHISVIQSSINSTNRIDRARFPTKYFGRKEAVPINSSSQIVVQNSLNSKNIEHSLLSPSNHPRMAMRLLELDNAFRNIGGKRNYFKSSQRVKLSNLASTRKNSPVVNQ